LTAIGGITIKNVGHAHGWHQYVEAGLLDIKRSGKLAPAEEEAQRLQLHFKFDDDTFRVCLGFVDLLACTMHEGTDFHDHARKFGDVGA
jgi:hypothetical protein